MTSIKKMGVGDVMCNLIMIINYQSIVACIHVVTEGQLQRTVKLPAAEILSGKNVRTCVSMVSHLKR